MDALPGWRPDPSHVHEFRFFAMGGKPTRLVSDNSFESVSVSNEIPEVAAGIPEVAAEIPSVAAGFRRWLLRFRRCRGIFRTLRQEFPMSPRTCKRTRVPSGVCRRNQTRQPSMKEPCASPPNRAGRPDWPRRSKWRRPRRRGSVPNAERPTKTPPPSVPSVASEFPSAGDEERARGLLYGCDSGPSASARYSITRKDQKGCSDVESLR